MREMNISTILTSIGILSILVQLLLIFPYRKRDYFRKESYYQILNKIKDEASVIGAILIFLFYVSVFSLVLLTLQSFIKEI